MSRGGDEAPPSGIPTRGQERFYAVGRGVVWAWTRTIHRLRVERVENVPTEGGVVVASNHQSFLDIPVISAAVPRHVAFVARDTLASSAVLRFLMENSGAILVRRGRPDREALDAMVANLRAGGCVALFPEGTRSVDGRVGPLRGGALLAARRAGVPVLPAGIRGAREALPRSARFPRPRRIGVRFGTPVDPAAPGALERLQAEIESLVGGGSFGGLPPV